MYEYVCVCRLAHNCLKLCHCFTPTYLPKYLPTYLRRFLFCVTESREQRAAGSTAQSRGGSSTEEMRMLDVLGEKVALTTYFLRTFL